MNGFNTARFKKYALYDLTVNCRFYRNTAFSVVGTLMGLTATGFMFRYMISGMGSQDAVGFASYHDMSMTVAMLIMACNVILVILAGYTFHCLTTKQGRINELTLPASNKEKFAWHIVMSLGGGLLLCLLGLILSDVLNALLSIVALPLDAQQSLVWNVLRSLSMSETRNMINLSTGNGDTSILLGGGLLFVYCSGLCNLAAYVYGNSIKYRHNIILTYAVLMAVTILSWMVLLTIGVLFPYQYFSAPQVMDFMQYGALAGSLFMLLLAALLLWLAYRRYCKAVVTRV